MPRVAALHRIRDWLGLRRSIVGLLGMVVLVGLGEKMAERFLPIYLVALGGGVISVGLLNGLDNLLSALYSLPGGYLSDRLGTKRALLDLQPPRDGGLRRRHRRVRLAGRDRRPRSCSSRGPRSRCRPA